MSWLISQALMRDFENSRCSQEPVEEFSVATCSAGEPSSQLNVMPTQHKFWRNDKTMEPSDLSRFGLTCAALTADRGEALLTWYRAGFPVKTSASPERAQASTASAPACGPTWRASLARFDRASSTWRTAQQSLLGDSDECSPTWPRSGMTVDGQCWELMKLAPPTNVIASGLWLPTPCTVDTGSMFNRSDSPNAALRPTLGAMAKYSLWPTPDASMGTGGRTSANFPTGKRASGTKQQITLNDAVKWWPTPCASDWKGSSKPGQRRGQLTDPDAGAIPAGGSLNPTWVEWLMGWPLGWTDLKPLATAKCHSAPRPHSECSSLSSIEAAA